VVGMVGYECQRNRGIPVLQEWKDTSVIGIIMGILLKKQPSTKI